uniref:Probable manganese-transporting ATPase PDR2 n=1 Tax=Dermatophagoides pteronyssinus TaxID=6956 RepID=A0A6P6XLJ2_DERPT|nr:probable manganese-transporting ATPase PDR2 [Dermatophagoides pteronyssinus]
MVQLHNDPDVLHSKVDNSEITILKRYLFNSNDQRMTTIVKYKNEVYVLMKGAPSKVIEFVKNPPVNYEVESRKISMQGKRVIALAYKKLKSRLSLQDLNQYTRSMLEEDLILSGLIYYTCLVKSQTVKTIKLLRNTLHSVRMITGDDPITAGNISYKCSIIDTDNFFLLNYDSENGFSEYNINTWTTTNVSIDEVLTSKNKNYVIDGKNLARLEETNYDLLVQLVNRLKIFARIKPRQKQLLIKILNDLGNVTLMCGDGTNDVGALKEAHVGVNLMNAEEVQDKEIDEINHIDECTIEPVKLSRSRRKAALVRVIMSYKMMALNSLVTAFSLSVLTMYGVKFGINELLEFSNADGEAICTRLGGVEIAYLQAIKRLAA